MFCSWSSNSAPNSRESSRCAFPINICIYSCLVLILLAGPRSISAQTLTPTAAATTSIQTTPTLNPAAPIPTNTTGTATIPVARPTPTPTFLFGVNSSALLSHLSTSVSAGQALPQIRAYATSGTLLGVLQPNGSRWIGADYYIVGDGPNTLELWSPFGQGNGGDQIAGVLLNAMVKHLVDKKLVDRYQWKLNIVGWSAVASQDICTSEPNTPCPDIIILGTTQIIGRKDRNDIAPLDQYFASYFDRNGRNLQDDFQKFTIYDYFLDGSWSALPFISDIR
ncbi:hypothetical protein HK102_002675, partial [Quaeritorhiza haematococci]